VLEKTRQVAAACDIIDFHGDRGKCPSCGKELTFDPDKVTVSPLQNPSLG